MTKTNKCDADVCFGASRTRCPLVRCELCSMSVHTKCANISNAMHKLLRESPGTCWLCVKCRDPESKKNRDTTRLILHRTTSSLKLIGALVESMQLFCQMYSRSCPAPAPAQSQVDRSFSEMFQDAPNFTELFASIISDQRQRTSSVSRPSSSPPDKATEVDVPIVNILDASTTVSSFSDATNNSGVPKTVPETATLAAVLAVTEHAAADAVSQHISTVVPGATADDTSPPAAVLIATAERAATLAVEQANARAAKEAATHAAQLATARAAVTAAENATKIATKQATEQIAALAAAHAIELAAARACTVAITTTNPTAAHTTVPNTAAAIANATEQAAVTGGIELAVALTSDHASAHALDHISTATPAVRSATPTAECATLQVTTATNQHATAPVVLVAADDDAVFMQPILSIAPAETPKNWFYITRFLPSETTENIISYIHHKTNCDIAQVKCHKLVRHNNKGRPPTFISFKICVPDQLETTVTADDFWPTGVSIKPFLDERPVVSIPTRSRSRAMSRGPPPKPNAPQRPITKRPFASGQQQTVSLPKTPTPVTQTAVLPPQYHQLPYLPMYQHFHHPAHLYNYTAPQM